MTYVAQKRRGLKSNAQKIDTLFIGSSHGDYGMNSRIIPFSYNLCTTSQDLYESFSILEFALSIRPCIKEVILSYSVFSYALDTSISTEGFRSAALKLQFGINFRRETEFLRESFNNLDHAKPLDTDDRFHSGFIHSLTPEPLPAEFTAARRAIAHSKFSATQANKEDSQHFYLSEIFRITSQYSKKFSIIIPPMKADYRNAIPPKAELFLPIHSFANDHSMKLLDLYDSNWFDDSDFIDADHLHPWGNGSKKVACLARNFFGI